MNWELIFTIFVSLLGHVHATDGSERECQDLKNMRTQLEKAFKLVPDSNVKCKPNSNCTGLACNGKVKGKRFKGTVILEGCHDPVRMLIYFNKRRMNVTDGFDKQVSSKPVPIRVNVGLVKKGDTVSVTLTIKICLIGKVCFPYRILKNQKIRVHCNDSAGPKISPSQNPWPFSRNSNLAGKGSKNPECKGLINTKKQVEQHFGNIMKIYPQAGDSKIQCNPAVNCSELQCAGFVNKDHFNTTATIDYCSDHVKLRLAVDVPNKKIHIDHNFKNGESYQITNIPPISIKVILRRVGNIIYVTVAIPIPIIGKDQYLVKNMSIVVDPSHCQGYHAPPVNVKCEKMAAVGESGCPKSSGHSLSSAGIAGIVVAVIIFFVILIAIIVWIVHGKRKRAARYNDLAMNDDADPLVFDSAPIA